VIGRRRKPADPTKYRISPSAGLRNNTLLNHAAAALWRRATSRAIVRPAKKPVHHDA
jgi:hypothetical protein